VPGNRLSRCDADRPVDELIRVGPFDVGVPLPTARPRASARLLVTGGERPVTVSGGTATMTIDSILDHEVIVLE
jgi:hypothetical protein